MELRNTEKEVQSILESYTSLRERKVESPFPHSQSSSTSPSRSYFCRDYMPLISTSIKEEEEVKQKVEGIDDEKDDDDDSVVIVSSPIDEGEEQIQMKQDEKDSTNISCQNLMEQLESLHSRIKELQPLSQKFRTRMKMKDPVSNVPRYGEKTMSRVQSLLHIYDQLQSAISSIFSYGIDDENNSGKGMVVTASNDKSSSNLLAILHEVIHYEEKQLEYQAQEAKLRKQQEVEQEEQIEQKQKQEEIKKQEELLSQKEMERIELAKKAQEVKEDKQRRLEEQRQVELREKEEDRAFIESVPKRNTKEGIRMQINRLKESCNITDYTVAVKSLHMLFTQITKHPEQIQFRKVRVDHQQFVSDIGRHDGGREFLIAAGFTIEKLDGIKCFFSKEPNLESDMDGWSSWFDNLKCALEVIEEELS